MARALKSPSQWNSNEICLPLEINLSVRIISYCWNVFINAIEWAREWMSMTMSEWAGKWGSKTKWRKEKDEDILKNIWNSKLRRLHKIGQKFRT